MTTLVFPGQGSQYVGMGKDFYDNFEVAKRWGFKQLLHEYQREGTIEDYNQIDSIGYLLNQFMKYLKKLI